MNRLRHQGTMAAFAVACAACAVGCGGASTVGPPPELAQARIEYAREAGGPAAHYDPATVTSAKVLLDRAEADYRNSASTPATRMQAYLALRKAELAEANANALVAIAARDAAQKELVQAMNDKLAATRNELQSAQGQLGEAQKRAQDAQRGVTELQARDEARGRVIALPGTVLFAPGKAELRPSASNMLDQVARVVRDIPDRHVRIEGYTDSTGGPELNLMLSQSRAQAVRDFLVSRGVPPSRITAMGFGATRPIAENSTEEGRATNRRVEVVIEKAAEPAR